MNEAIAKHKFLLGFDAIAEKAHKTAMAKGWWDTDLGDNTFLLNVHREISEGTEALSHGNPPDKHCPEFSSIEVELADAIIRIMDQSVARGWDVSGAVVAKMAYNEGREYKHGGKLF